MKKILTILAILAIFMFAGTAFADSNVTIVWDANSESDLAGYKLYQGTATGVYDSIVADIPVGTEIVTVSNIPDGTYFWVLTAYDLEGNESGPSNEVSATLDSVAPGAPTILNITAIVKAP